MSSSTSNRNEDGEMKQKRSYSQMRAEHFKTQGNTFFSEGRFRKAMQLYTEAVRYNPNEPIYLTNRAIAAFRYNETLIDRDLLEFITSMDSLMKRGSAASGICVAISKILEFLVVYFILFYFENFQLFFKSFKWRTICRSGTVQPQKIIITKILICCKAQKIRFPAFTISS